MNMEAISTKIETQFDSWLKKFSDEPVATSFKVLVVIVVLRWIWKYVK